MPKSAIFICHNSSFLWSHRGTLIKALLQEGYFIRIFTFENKVVKSNLPRVEHVNIQPKIKLQYFYVILQLLKFLKRANRDEVKFIHVVSLRSIILVGLLDFLNFKRFSKGINIYFAVSGMGSFLGLSHGKILKTLSVCFVKYIAPNAFCTWIIQNEGDYAELETLGAREIELVLGSGYTKQPIIADNVLTKNEPPLIMCCRLKESKGVYDFVRLISILAHDTEFKKYSKIGRLVLSVDSTAHGKIQKEEFIKFTHDQTDKVELVFNSNDVSTYLELSEIFICLSSVGEGIPKAAIEAVAHGLPLIGYKVRGVEDLILKANSGIILEEKNLREVAKSVIVLRQDKKLYSRFSMNGKTYAEQELTEQKIISRHFEIWGVSL